jgi:YD repeat-containing protein
MSKLLKRIIFIPLLICCLVLPVHAAEYYYDELDRLIRVEYETGQTVTYTYDAGGNILDVEVYIPLQLEPIGDKQVDAGHLLEFTVEATGAEGAEIEYRAQNLPTGANFDTATQLFSWIPEFDQAGIHSGIRFEAFTGGATVSEEISITVNVVNTAPGTDIEFEDEESGIMLTFDAVDRCGNTSVAVHETLPEGEFFNVSFLPLYFDITTSALFSGQVRITVSYEGLDFDLDEEDIRLFHFLDGEAVDITDPVDPGPGGNPDTSAKTISGVTEGFSIFGLGVVNEPVELKLGGDPVKLYSLIPRGTPVSWSSSNPDVATVDELGFVTPVALGSTAITVVTSDGRYSSTYDVLVQPYVHWLPPISVPSFLRDMGEFLINPNQTLPVKFYLTDEQEDILHLDNVEVQVWSENREELMGKYTLTGSGQMQLKRNPQGIYHANIKARALNLSPGETYDVAVMVADIEADAIKIRIKD